MKLLSALRVFFAGLAVAIGSGAAQAQPMKLEFLFPTPTQIGHAPYNAAIDQGFFKDEGLEIETKYLSGSGNVFRLLVSGQGDIAYVANGVVQSGILAGANVRAISSVQPISDHQFIVSAKGSGRIADYADKKIATLTAGALTSIEPMALLKKHGARTDKIEWIMSGAVAARLQGIAAGTFDAAAVDLFNSLKGVRGGDAKILASIPAEFPGFGLGYDVVRADSLKDPAKRKALKAYVKALVKGARYVMQNPKGATAGIMKRLPKLEPDLVEETIVKLNELKLWPHNGGVERSVTEFTSRVHVEYGGTDLYAREVKYEEIVDPSLVDEVIKDLGKI